MAIYLNISLCLRIHDINFIMGLYFTYLTLRWLTIVSVSATKLSSNLFLSLEEVGFLCFSACTLCQLLWVTYLWTLICVPFLSKQLNKTTFLTIVCYNIPKRNSGTWKHFKIYNFCLKYFKLILTKRFTKNYSYLTAFGWLHCPKTVGCCV